MTAPERRLGWVESVDLIVLGSGGAGLTAALVGAIEGLRVVVLERTEFIGGTTAYSSGTLWVPGFSTFAGPTEQQAASGAAETYLDALVGDMTPKALRAAFLANGPQMLRYLADCADVRFRTYAQSPDYNQHLPGASAGGQAHEPLPFDGRLLGDRFDDVRWPIPELMLFGGMMVTRGEAMQLLRAWKSPAAAWLGLKLLAGFLRDRPKHGRGTRLVLGNALVARLLKGLLDHGGEVRLSQDVAALVREGGTVTGVTLSDGRRLRARRGVVLAGGGFPADPEWRERYLPRPLPQYTPACPSCVGGTLRLGLAVGGTLGTPPAGPALWFPSSVAPRADGSAAVYPHIVLDRAKPGLIAVNRAGRRFTDEAVSYHQFSHNMYKANAQSPAIPAALVCDSAFIWKYGLGMIRPMTPRLAGYVRRGYLKTGRTVEELAGQLGVDPAQLKQTVTAYNTYAATGVDPEFGKGSNVYDRSNGDPAHGPNPCIGALVKPPFYGVLVYPTPVATAKGLVANEHAQVLDEEGAPIVGLYVCGNDMNSIMGGHYQGPGGQLGPGMTFAYVAARHAAGLVAREAPARADSAQEVDLPA